jgi:hypothetical protein
LYTHRPLLDDREEEAADRQTSSLSAIAVILVLLIVSLFLVHRLHHASAVEDCLMSGRSNCEVQVPLEP